MASLAMHFSWQHHSITVWMLMFFLQFSLIFLKYVGIHCRDRRYQDFGTDTDTDTLKPLNRYRDWYRDSEKFPIDTGTDTGTQKIPQPIPILILSVSVSDFLIRYRYSRLSLASPPKTIIANTENEIWTLRNTPNCYLFGDRNAIIRRCRSKTKLS